jgi:hypothetical protein
MNKSIFELAQELFQLEEIDSRTELQQRRRRELFRLLLDLLRRQNNNERRRFWRVPAPLSVRFRVGEATLEARAEEMSLGGLSIRDHLWVIAGQRMRIESIRLRGRQYPLNIRCRVVWRVSPENRPCAGLEFLEIDRQGRAQIRAIFEALFIAFLRHMKNDDKLSKTKVPLPPPEDSIADDDDEGSWLSGIREESQ